MLLYTFLTYFLMFFSIKFASRSFFGIFLMFFIIKFAFVIIFIFFNEVSNFGNSLLTKQKRELLFSNCQRNCIFQTVKSSNEYTWTDKRQNFTADFCCYWLFFQLIRTCLCADFKMTFTLSIISETHFFISKAFFNSALTLLRFVML